MAGALALAIPLLVSGATGPGWWYNPALTVSGTMPIIRGAPNDYAAVTQGQLKNFAVTAVNELNKDIPQFGGAGGALNSLKQSLLTSDTAGAAQDFAPVLLGQLKTMVQPFYDRLLSIGYTLGPLASGTYPWVNAAKPASDFAAANIGQDSPTSPADYPPNTELDRSFTGQMNYMWRPDIRNSIWVPLRVISWGFSGQIEWSFPGWSLAGESKLGANVSPPTEEPIWKGQSHD